MKILLVLREGKHSLFVLYHTLNLLNQCNVIEFSIKVNTKQNTYLSTCTVLKSNKNPTRNAQRLIWQVSLQILSNKKLKKHYISTSKTGFRLPKQASK